MSSGHQRIQFNIQPGGRINGQVRVPGDKSISHRSIMLASLALGESHISGFLEGDDSMATLKAFQAMGVNIIGPEAGQLVVHGVGLHGLKAPAGELYLGNSGTSMRLMCGLLAGQAFDSVLTGDDSLSGRPMARVIDPLISMNASIESTAIKTAPIRIKGQQKLQSIDYQLPVASAQVKSCLFLAGLYANGKTCVTEPAPTRDHTERMLKGFGYSIERQDSRVCLNGEGTLTATQIDIPADISSAAFFMVAASIADSSDITLNHVGVNPTRTGVIDILKLMGANIELHNLREVGGEPVADIRVVSASLKGIEIPVDLVPLAIDEFPALFIAAACAAGTTTLTGARELRVKESDRIQVMADGLGIMGVSHQVTDDGIVIHGGQLQGGEVESHGDHRIAMSFAIAALRCQQPVTINDCANVNTSFPGFVELSQQLGLQISSQTS